jgi:hypothetical protein
MFQTQLDVAEGPTRRCCEPRSLMLSTGVPRVQVRLRFGAFMACPRRTRQPKFTSWRRAVSRRGG